MAERKEKIRRDWLSKSVAGTVLGLALGLAAGGFVLAGTVHILHLHRYERFVRPAILTAFLGYVLAVLGEEMGLIGTMGLATLFLLFAVRGYHIAKKTKDNFGKLLAVGLTSLISGQALLNMLVVTSTVPATGVPLPFISYGGSSLMLNLMSVGILLGISQYPDGGNDENRPYRRRHRRSRVPRR